MKRREFLAGATALALSMAPLVSFAQPAMENLLAPGPLAEKSFGDPKAPVTIIEYASLTCPHCKDFHINTWPALKAKYVDSGKVRFIMREFPFDPRASAGFMLARCSPEDKWYATVDLLYRAQDRWARVDDPATALKSIMGVTGMTGNQVESCLQDQALLDRVTAVADAGRGFGVDSTPTFFINGTMQKGALSIDKFSELIDPLISGAKQ